MLCADGELTVSELTDVLAVEQPRVSRHLKILCDAGLLDRFREGAWVFYRLAQGAGGALARTLIDAVPADDTNLALDRRRLGEIRCQRARAAAKFFDDNAGRWDELRRLYVHEAKVEAGLLGLFSLRRVRCLLDIGTGTGRMLEVFAPFCDRAIGVDLSLEMLTVARVNLAKAGLGNCSVGRGDMYKLPQASASADAVIFHQVLHYAEEPGAAISEAARVLAPGGLIAIADFFFHDLEHLRTHHAHRRLGFGDEEISGWCHSAGLAMGESVRLAGDPLTVVIWSAEKPVEASEEKYS